MNSESAKYKFGRNLSNAVFSGLLKPEIINADYIPKNGPIVLCGNHLHVWDQFPVMAATNRTIHWLAKKEYFDSYLGWVFKFMECICVDREGNTHSSKEQAISYLKKRSAIGIFPEGTRNGLKEKNIQELYNDYIDNMDIDTFRKKITLLNPKLSQINLLKELYNNKMISKEIMANAIYDPDCFLKQCVINNMITNEQYDDSLLLPLFSGAIDMAKKTDALIVPFCVTGNYIIGNDNLQVEFAKPFGLNFMSVEEGKEKLKNTIIDLEKNKCKTLKK